MDWSLFLDVIKIVVIPAVVALGAFGWKLFVDVLNLKRDIDEIERDIEMLKQKNCSNDELERINREIHQQILLQLARLETKMQAIEDLIKNKISNHSD